MTSVAEQQESPSLDLQALLMTSVDQQNSSGAVPPQLFEQLFAQALAQTQRPTTAAASPSPPQSADSEHHSPIGATPTSTTAPSLPTDEEAAKFMASLLNGGFGGSGAAPSLNQSQPTSPELENSTNLFEQLQLMGLLPQANGMSAGSGEAADWKEPFSVGAGSNGGPVDISAFFNSQALNLPTSGNSSYNQSSKPSDAYCDICNKVLCNRYFLRTHRWKKHGISDPGQPPFPTTTSNAVDPSSAPNNNTTTTTTTSPAFASPLPIKSELTPMKEWESGQKRSAPDDSAAPVAPFAKMPKLTAATNENGGGAQIGSTASSPTKSPSMFPCDACDVDFPSLSNLIQHQIVSHGGSAMPVLPNANNGTPTTMSPSGHHTPQQPTPTLSTSQLGSPNNVINSLLMQLQMPAAMQPLQSLFGFPAQSAFPFGSDLDVQRMAQQLSAASNNNGSQLNGLNTPSPQVKTPKRQYSSTSKNFCDLCNKEVCNKYFLRTHMLKMHNIVIDENKSVIANIDTLEREKEGGLSFRCDVCRLKLDTRQQLREHKKEIHGIVPLSTTAGSTASATSSECDSKTPNSASATNFFATTAESLDDEPQIDSQENMSPSSSASSTVGTAESVANSCTLLNSALSREELMTQVALQMVRSNEMEMGSKKVADDYLCNSCDQKSFDGRSNLPTPTNTGTTTSASNCCRPCVCGGSTTVSQKRRQPFMLRKSVITDECSSDETRQRLNTILSALRKNIHDLEMAASDGLPADMDTEVSVVLGEVDLCIDGLRAASDGAAPRPQSAN